MVTMLAMNNAKNASTSAMLLCLLRLLRRYAVKSKIQSARGDEKR